jgi:hypothetical protein
VKAAVDRESLKESIKERTSERDPPALCGRIDRTRVVNGEKNDTIVTQDGRRAALEIIQTPSSVLWCSSSLQASHRMAHQYAGDSRPRKREMRTRTRTIGGTTSPVLGKRPGPLHDNGLVSV